MDIGRFCSIYVMVIQQQAVRPSETKGETDNATCKVLGLQDSPQVWLLRYAQGNENDSSFNRGRKTRVTRRSHTRSSGKARVFPYVTLPFFLRWYRSKRTAKIDIILISTNNLLVSNHSSSYLSI